MSIEQCIKNELRAKLIGVTGILTNDTFHTYRRCEGGQYFCLPDENIGAILRGDITTATKSRLLVAMTESIQRFKQSSPWMSIITFATPALEILSPEQLSALGLELFSLNEIIARHCIKSGIKRPALLGTEWDTAPDSPLVKMLAEQGIEAQRLSPEEQRMYRLMTACVFNRMSSYINCEGTLKEASDFCVDVVNRLLYETVGTLDAFIVCNPELRPLISRLHQRLKRGNAALPIINASALHLTALTARTFKNPPS